MRAECAAHSSSHGNGRQCRLARREHRLFPQAIGASRPPHGSALGLKSLRLPIRRSVLRYCSSLRHAKERTDNSPRHAQSIRSQLEFFPPRFWRIWPRGVGQHECHAGALTRTSTVVVAYRLGLKSRFRSSDMDAYLGSFGIRTTPVFGPDLSGRSIEQLRPLYSRRRARALFGRDLTSSEVSATIGHRRMLRHFLQSREPWGLMLEDDAMPADGLGDFLRQLPAPPGSWLLDLYNPHGGADGGPDSHQIFLGGVAFRQRRFPVFGSVGYAVTREAAQALLRAHRRRRIDSPPDWPPAWLGQCRFLEAQTTLVEHPPGDLASLIQGERRQVPTRYTGRQLRSAPGGSLVDRSLRASGVLSLVRFTVGVPLRYSYLRDRQRLYDYLPR